jgi:hypothetical protein
MKSAIISLVILVTFALGLSGCGGSSSGAAESSYTPSPPTDATKTIEINPLVELGLEKGSNICIRIKAYTNTSESDFSEAICTKIIDSESIELSWNNTSQNVIGYEIYYGNTESTADNFLQDIMAV